MADELDFGFPATSTRTSSDDFTTTTLTGFADKSLDYTYSALGDDAGPAHAAGSTPRFEGSDGGAASRATSLQRTSYTSQAGPPLQAAVKFKFRAIDHFPVSRPSKHQAGRPGAAGERLP